MIKPNPSTKFAQGSVPSIIPRLPNSVGTKFIIEDAVPTFSLASKSKISIANGRITAPIAVNGKKLIKNTGADDFPNVKTKIPLKIAVKNAKRNIPAFDSEFFSLKYKIGPKIDAAELIAKK